MISPEVRKRVIALYQEGHSKTMISEKTGVSRSTITIIIREAGIRREDSSRLASEGGNVSRQVVKEKGNFQISPGQLSRLQGMSHLAGGENISSILDRMLDSDANIEELKKTNIKLRAENELLIGASKVIYLRKIGLSDYVVTKAKSLGHEDNIMGFINAYVKEYFVVLDNWKRADAGYNECVERLKEAYGMTEEVKERRVIRYEL